MSGISDEQGREPLGNVNNMGIELLKEKSFKTQEEQINAGRFVGNNQFSGISIFIHRSVRSHGNVGKSPD